MVPQAECSFFHAAMKKNSEFDLFFEKADVIYLHQHAGVAELADALRSGRSGSNPVGVQIPPPVPNLKP